MPDMTMKTEIPDNGKYQTLVDHCIELYTDFSKSEYRAKKIAEIKESITRYEQDAPKVTFPWDDAYNIYLPLVTITIDNLEPRLVASLVGRDPIISFGNDVQGMPEYIESWYNEELKNVVKIEKTATSCVHTMLLEGTWFAIPTYDLNEIEIDEFQFVPPGAPGEGTIQIDDKGQPIKSTVLSTMFEGGLVSRIPFSDVFCADDIGTEQEWEMADKIIKIRPTYAHLMTSKDSAGYMNIGHHLLSEKTQRKLKESGQKTPDQIVAGVDISGKETIECLECHMTFPNANLVENPPEEHEQTDFSEERLIVTIAVKSQTIIRIQKLRDVNMNNRNIVKRVRMYAENGRSFGTSTYGKMKSIQDGSSEMFSLLMNIAVICMMPWYFYEEGSGVQGKQEIYPAAGVKVSDINKVKMAEFKINPSQYIEFINLWLQLWERIGGISDPQIGKVSDQKSTATEILTVVEEGNIKHNYQAKTFKEEFLDVIRCLYDLYYQYMPYDKTLEIDGKEGIEEIPFPRFAMRRPENFKLTGSSEKANKLIERKESEDMYAQLRQDPLVNPMSLVEDIVKNYGKEDKERYINPEIGQLVQMVQEHPEVIEIVGQYVNEKMNPEGGEGGQGGGGQGQGGGPV